MNGSNWKKLTASVVTIGALGAVAAFGIFGAFSAEVSNSGNEFSAGTLTLDDNNHTQPVYFKSDAVPGDNGDNCTRCISIDYSGPVTANLKLFGSNAGATGLEEFLNVEVTSGTGSDEDCGDFVASGADGDVYDGTLEDFNTDHTGWANGISLGTIADSGTKAYRFYAELPASTPAEDAQGLNAGDQTFTWEVQAGS